MGGTLAYYAARGIQVHLVCATRGEVGEISDPALATPENLGSVRERELRAACEELGIHEPLFLDYRDSGMAGTPENGHPGAFSRAMPGAVVRRLKAIFHQRQPQVVVTFDARGGYGHPDHMAAHRHTTQAFKAAGLVEAGARLYYVAIPRSRLQAMVAQAPPDSPFRDLDPDLMGTPDEEITTQVDVSSVLDRKLRAIACHKTQIPREGFLWGRSEEEVRGFLSAEYFQLAWPLPEVGQGKEDGLFPR
jgi:LmbE family N-acetylglucosaminyl deacetylase